MTGVCYNRLPWMCTLNQGRNVSAAHGAMGRQISSSYFSSQPVLYNWCDKGCGMYYPVCEIVHMKDALLLTGNSRPLNGGRVFPGKTVPASLIFMSGSLIIHKYRMEL